MNINEEPIFIGGAGRSGKTLLRVMLDSHPNICCGPELKVFTLIANLYQHFTGPYRPYLEAYGNNLEDLNGYFRTLILQLVQNFRRNSGKPRWAEKTPHNVLYMTTLGAIFPKSRFLNVIRDGRDVACDLVTMDWTDAQGTPLDCTQNIASAARYWKSVVMESLEQTTHPSLEDRALIVRYEDLVQDTERIMRIVLDFLGEPWSDSVLRHHEFAHHFIDESSTDEVQGPIFDADIGRWEREMSDEDKTHFRQEAGDLLKNLRYVQGEW